MKPPFEGADTGGPWKPPENPKPIDIHPPNCHDCRLHATCLMLDRVWKAIAGSQNDIRVGTFFNFNHTADHAESPVRILETLADICQVFDPREPQGGEGP